MIELLNKIDSEINSFTLKNKSHLEEFRLKYLTKNGSINLLFKDFKNIASEDKKKVGQLLNDLKNKAQFKYNELYNKLNQSFEKIDFKPDLSLSLLSKKLGTRHPVSIIRNEIIRIFSKIGFIIEEGPEVEDDWHVFTGLNFALEHPARDMQDTFFIQSNPSILLRTHTSSVQVRVMENAKPPIRAIFPGRVFRNESISARAHCIFHQIEGLYIDKNVSFFDLRQTLLFFAKEMFGEKTEIRLRPSFFPFTEPSAEMDVSCTICGGKGCNICKYTGFVEILGCGMVDPQVLENCSIDSSKYTGFAFGMGIERITMLKYLVNDLRLYFENDIRFLNQFISIL